MMQKIKNYWRREPVLCIAVILAALSSLYSRPQLAYIDFDVLAILLSLMLMVAELKEIRFLDWLAVELLNKCRSKRQLELVLLAVTYVSSMFVTNDVALLTFVPLALVIGKTLKMDMERIIIMQTLAANLGSMLTPPGNPQNLFLYAHYAYTAGSFFAVMAVPGIISLAYLLLLLFHGKDSVLKLELPKLQQPPKGILLLFLGLLLLNIGAVLHWFDKLWALLLTAGVVALCDWRRLREVDYRCCRLWRYYGLCDWRRLREVDYSLLVTFAGFFVFIGNISHSPAVSYLQQSLMGSAAGTYLTGLLASQFLSNVPAAMLLAGLTKEADALLLGVNIGGLGTMIASMASVISYKLYAAEHPSQAGKYVRTFLYYNFLGLLLIGGAVYFLL